MVTTRCPGIAAVAWRPTAGPCMELYSGVGGGTYTCCCCGCGHGNGTVVPSVTTSVFATQTGWCGVNLLPFTYVPFVEVRSSMAKSWSYSASMQCFPDTTGFCTTMSHSGEPPITQTRFGCISLILSIEASSLAQGRWRGRREGGAGFLGRSLTLAVLKEVLSSLPEPPLPRLEIVPLTEHFQLLVELRV